MFPSTGVSTRSEKTSDGYTFKKVKKIITFNVTVIRPSFFPTANFGGIGEKDGLIAG